MKKQILKILSISKNNPFIIINGGKISFGIIIFGTAFLLIKKGVLTAFQFVGFTSFILGILFVTAMHKLDISSHQQEQVRPNFKERKHQRTMLLLFLTLIITFFAALLLFNYPYAFLFF